MTKLNIILDHTLSISCGPCEHSCGQKNQFHFRIIYVGSSYDAMLEADTKPINLEM